MVLGESERDALDSSEPRRLIPPRLAAAAQGFVGRRWALDEVAEWLDGDQRFFLLSGQPGSGKSTLAAWLAGAGPVPDDAESARRLQAVRGAWGAVHFCILRGQGGSIDPRRFTEVLASQLADRYDQFALAAIRRVTPEYNIHLDVRENWGQVVGIRTENLIVTGVSPSDAYAVAVIEPLRALLEARPQLRVHILVDALDEALTPAATNIVTLLAASNELPDNVRFLCTTRNERRVLDLFTDRFDDIRWLNLSDDRTARRNEADIRSHIVRRLGHLPVERGAAAEPIVDGLVRRANGNFLYVDVLVDEMMAGRRPLGDLSGLPRGLHDLYRAYLSRIMPEMEWYGGSQAWLTRYQPLLGFLSVATPAAPGQLLPSWLHWEESEVLARLGDLQQIFEFDPHRESGGYRLFHQSLADFLATDRYQDNGTERINQYYIPPREQHDRLADYYLTSLRESWAGDWMRCDRYGLRHLVQHMEAALRLTEAPEERRRRAEALYSVVLDPGFQVAQRRRLGDVAATNDAFRAALEVALSDQDIDRAEQLLQELAAAPEVELRGLGVEGLVKLHARAPARAIGLIKRLLSQGTSSPRSVGLKATYLIGSEAMDVFRWVVLDGSPELRQAVSYALYLWWRRQPDGGLTLRVLNDLGALVSLRSPRRARRALELMGDLSITIYTNHCERPEVVTQLSELWHKVLKYRLHLGALPRVALTRMLSPIAANAHARRVLETFLLVELQDPARFFTAPAEDKARFRRIVSLIDPAADPRPLEGDIKALLHADVLLFRFTTAVALGVHAYRDFPAVRPLLLRLFDQAEGDARLWELLSFAVLLPDTPADWTPLLEQLTARLVREDPATVLAGVDAGGSFDFAFLPLGLAYGKRGGSMPQFETLLRESLGSRDLALVSRIVKGLGVVGFYYPQSVFRTLEHFLTDLREPELIDSLVAALAVIRVLHFDPVDLFLRQEGLEHLQAQISALAEVELVRRYVAWIGFVNNSVHLTLHYPKMRRHLLVHALETLADCRDAGEFLRRHTPEQLTMLFEADFELARWTLPE
jgi:hypothetical protein